MHIYILYTYIYIYFKLPYLIMDTWKWDIWVWRLLEAHVCKRKKLSIISWYHFSSHHCTAQKNKDNTVSQVMTKTPPTTPPIQQLQHCSYACLTVCRLNTTGAGLQPSRSPRGEAVGPFFSPSSQQWWAIKTLHTLNERYDFKYFTHILHMQFLHTWL